MSTRKSRAGRRWAVAVVVAGVAETPASAVPEPTPLAQYREYSRQAAKLSRNLLDAQADLDRAGQDLTAAKNAGATAASDKARRQVDVDRCSVVCLGSAQADNTVQDCYEACCGRARRLMARSTSSPTSGAPW
ncbi:hypothetical protein AB0K15_17325 [Amycolatopsis sp. NPDC049253]|uniref:hypothetical protein n=1 Tax=Amycolatopsis sp. NPDC049253 TaxID=3155274 RepID=UPI00342B117E